MANQYSESDWWTRKAFSEGYPARSVYKLEEINKKFSLFSTNAHILDLGAAPGSWTSFLLRNLESKAIVVSVDLKELDNKIKDDRLTFIQGDMTSKSIITKVKELSPFDVVLCDAAPYTTGNKSIDVISQNYLAELAAFYAKNTLKVNGSFVTKIFQGNDMKVLINDLKHSFSAVRTFKPQACRKSSIETYIIAKEFNSFIK